MTVIQMSDRELTRLRVMIELSDRKRKPMAAYRFGGLENTLLQPSESGLMSMIG